MTYCTIISSGGYVESGQVSSIIWTANSTFDNPIDAIKSLANDLLQMYYECCTQSSRDRFEPEEFVRWVYSLTSYDADSFGDDLHVWWPWNSYNEIVDQDPESIIMIREMFETIMLTCCDGSKCLSPKDKVLLSIHQIEQEMREPTIEYHAGKPCAAEHCWDNT